MQKKETETVINSAGTVGLHFRRIDVSARSALSAELAPDKCKGIYLYEFTDGTSYVGKSVDMVERYAQHLHEYRYRPDFTGAGIAAAYFANIDEVCDEAELDELEAAAEAEGRDLHNLLKVGRPGGNAGLLLNMDGEVNGAQETGKEQQGLQGEQAAEPQGLNQQARPRARATR